MAESTQPPKSTSPMSSSSVDEFEITSVTENPAKDLPSASAQQPDPLSKWVSSLTSNQKDPDAFLRAIRANKNFHNPAIFEKMIAFCGIDADGTNMKGRRELPADSYYKDVSDIQELYMGATD